MKIEFGNYVIEGKKGDWQVSETKVSKAEKSKGKEYTADSRFFGTLYQALLYLLNCKLGEADKVDIRKLTRLINKHCKEIKDIGDRING